MVLVILCASLKVVIINLLGAVGLLHQSYYLAILVLRLVSFIGRLVLAVTFHILPIVPIIYGAPIGLLD
jgi:hypothetical protein